MFTHQTHRSRHSAVTGSQVSVCVCVCVVSGKEEGWQREQHHTYTPELDDECLAAGANDTRLAVEAKRIVSEEVEATVTAKLLCTPL